ncbi:hypothetical protein HD806DRAFT_62183 [Xylariaceae sp. AK1471]|nr:hypothetical protein HD806DRAFT_62183 [Xylariaceae sp. AK1471]
MSKTVHILSYRLREAKLKEYLEKQFSGEKIQINIGDDTYSVELPKELTQGQHDDINDLRDKRRRNS